MYSPKDNYFDTIAQIIKENRYLTSIKINMCRIGNDFNEIIDALKNSTKIS